MKTKNLNKNVRLKDIAKLANVSIATVSIILKDPDTKRVSETKKKEVINIAEELNYIPNVFAQGLVKSSTKTIGLIIPDLGNPFFSRFAKEIESLARDNGYTTLIVNSDDDYKNDIQLLQFLHRRRVDAIILATSAQDVEAENEIVNIISQIDIPVITSDRALRNYKGSQIVFDNKLGIKLATKLCIEKGHKNIGFISAKDYSLNGYYRHVGYEEAMIENNLKVNENHIYYGTFHFDTGVDAAKYFAEKKISAVVCSNDLIAYGFKKEIEKYGYSIPNDISIVGFDNLEFNDYIGNGITSIDLDIQKLAHETIATLLKQIDNPKNIQRIVLEPTIKKRLSVMRIELP